MSRPNTQVWQDVEITLEFVESFDPKRLLETHPGLSSILGEFLIGPPRTVRTPDELALFAGLTSLESKIPRLRLHFEETKRLGLALDRLFGALEFNVIGRRVIAVPNPSPIELPEGWRAQSPVWLCHRPLLDAA